MARKKTISGKNIFIIDFDGTICDFDYAFLGIAHALSLLEEEDLEAAESRAFLRLSDCGMISEEDETKIIKLMGILNVYENMNIFPGVRDFLGLINSKGDHIAYMTSRPQEIAKQTIAWLGKNGLPRPQDDDHTNLTHRVTAFFSYRGNKDRNLKQTIDFHRNSNNVIVVDNSPKYAELALRMGADSVYTFSNSYMNIDDSRLRVLGRPDEFNVFDQLVREVYK